jgi:hypothetical protein
MRLSEIIRLEFGRMCTSWAADERSVHAAQTNWESLTLRYYSGERYACQDPRRL